jgi:SAM-dependent methyltransferase
MDVYANQKRYFEEAYQTGEHGWPTTDPTPFVKSFLQSFRKEKPRAKILDMGCGEGRHTLLFAGKGYFAAGMDLEPKALLRAKKFARELKLPQKPNFLLGNALALPFKGESFEVLIDYGCLHHIMKRDFSLYLRDTLSLLKPKGYFLLTCFSIRFKHQPEERRQRDWIIHKGHYDRFFRKSDFPKLFGKNYKILKIEEEKDPKKPHYVFNNVLMQKK